MKQHGPLTITSLLLLTGSCFAQVECWAPREEQDSAASQKFAFERKVLLSGEDLVRKNAAFLAVPEPVRLRSTIAAGPYEGTGARLLVRAYPPKSFVGLQIWTGKCEVIPQAERVDASIGQVDIFFNWPAEEIILRNKPKLEGMVAGYPMYDGRIYMSKNGRLPWIPITLRDKLTAELKHREQVLADWNKQKLSRKAPAEEQVQKTYAMLKRSDPGGAERYLAGMRELAETIRKQQQADPAGDAYFQRSIDECLRYLASFTAAQLDAPAVWADASGEAQRSMEARIRQLYELTPEEQRQFDGWNREGRALDRQAQAIARDNPAEAAKLRAQVAELAKKAHDLRRGHEERMTYNVSALGDEYKLANLKPGDREKAMGFKPDPNFPSSKDRRIELITVIFSVKADRRQVNPRSTWMQRTQDTLDYKSLAAMIE